jgi:hypothetical protein
MRFGMRFPPFATTGLYICQLSTISADCRLRVSFFAF